MGGEPAAEGIIITEGELRTVPDIFTVRIVSLEGEPAAKPVSCGPVTSQAVSRAARASRYHGGKDTRTTVPTSWHPTT